MTETKQAVLTMIEEGEKHRQLLIKSIEAHKGLIPIQTVIQEKLKPLQTALNNRPKDEMPENGQPNHYKTQ